MTASGLYEFGTDDKCALWLRINDWQDDLAKHAPPAGGRPHLKIIKHYVPTGKPRGRPRKDAAKGLEVIAEGSSSIIEHRVAG